MQKLDKDTAYSLMQQHFKQNPFYKFDLNSINWAMIQSDQPFEEFIKSLKLDEVINEKIIHSFKDSDGNRFFDEDKESINKNLYSFKYGICFTLMNPDDKQVIQEKQSLMERFLSESKTDEGNLDFISFLRKIWIIAFYLTVVNLHFVLIKLFISEDQEKRLYVNREEIKVDDLEFYIDEITEGFDEAFGRIFKGYSIVNVIITYFRTVLGYFGEEARKVGSKLDESFFQRFMDLDSSYDSNSNDEGKKLFESCFPKLKVDDNLKEKILKNASYIWSSDLMLRTFVEFDCVESAEENSE